MKQEGVKILEDKTTGYKCLCSIDARVAFGNIFHPEEDVQDFLGWLHDSDVRTFDDFELEKLINNWRDENGYSEYLEWSF